MSAIGSMKRQRGVVLVVALIMLMLMSLMAVATFNIGRQNTLIAGNMQNKAETSASASLAVETVISNAKFVESPDFPIDGTSNKVAYDINGDKTADVVVTMNPKPCIKTMQVLKNNELDITNASEMTCQVGTQQTLGVEGSAGAVDNSLCADSVWEITASAEDAVTGAASVVVAGVSVRASIENATDPNKLCN